MLLNWKSIPEGGIRRLKFIGCEIIYREACALAASGPHRVDVEFLLKGLHDLPREDMLAKIQAVVDAANPEVGYEAVLLGYARCNDGLVGLKARQIPLVIRGRMTASRSSSGRVPPIKRISTSTRAPTT